jgi:hypothetical protein
MHPADHAADGSAVAGVVRGLADDRRLGEIIEHLEREHPEPTLLPADPAAGAVLDVQRWFDTEVGPQVRNAAFVEWLADSNYGATHRTRDAAGSRRHRASFPLARGMATTMDLTRRHAEVDSCAGEAFAFVAEHAGPNGYLVGDRFSTFTPRLPPSPGPAVLPAEFPPAPQPYSPTFRHFLDRFCTPAPPGCATSTPPPRPERRDHADHGTVESVVLRQPPDEQRERPDGQTTLSGPR